LENLVKLITDSAADLTPADIQQYGIDVIPLFITFPDGEVSTNDITPDAFYDRLRSIVPQVPTTSQPSVAMFTERYQAALAAGENVLSVHISSGLSGTYNTSALAARQTDPARITTIDSLTLSNGQRFQVLAAAMAIAKGWSVDKIREKLAAIRADTEVIYTLETLDYLARGGRIGRVQGLLGGLLQIKPVIHVERSDGKYDTIARVRTVSQGLSTIVSHVKGLYGDQPVWASVMHGQWEEKAVTLADMLKEALNITRTETLRISPALGVHTGPGIVGCCVVPAKHFDDLV
jgi:DegV family protein with EDD domain